ncbi:MAG: dihydrofolate reductase family protein [Actinomycetota bacterium]
MEVLLNEQGLEYDLPPEIRRLYGGSFGFDGPVVLANFVESVNGVVAIRGVRSPFRLIRGDNEADRFVMGLLRACADAVLIGAGTFRATPGRWTAEAIYPKLAGDFAELRRRLGKPDHPQLVLLTSSGDLQPGALHPEDLIITTAAGANTVAERAIECRVEVLSETHKVDLNVALAFLRTGGFGQILCEAGPETTGQLVAKKLIDELFVTLSPALIGFAESELIGLLGGFSWEAPERHPAELRSVRRDGGHLFLRYRLT